MISDAEIDSEDEFIITPVTPPGKEYDCTESKCTGKWNHSDKDYKLKQYTKQL